MDKTQSASDKPKVIPRQSPGVPDIGLLEITNEKTRTKSQDKKSKRPSSTTGKPTGLTGGPIGGGRGRNGQQNGGRLSNNNKNRTPQKQNERRKVTKLQNGIPGQGELVDDKQAGNQWHNGRHKTKERMVTPNHPHRHEQSKGIANSKEGVRSVDSPNRTKDNGRGTRLKERTITTKVVMAPPNSDGEKTQKVKVPSEHREKESPEQEHLDSGKANKTSVEEDKPAMSQEAESDLMMEEKMLKKMGIHKLQKRKPKYPKAKYFCRLCNYHMDDLDDCEDHASQIRHKRLMKNKSLADNFKSVPKLTARQAEALTATIENIVRRVGLTPEMMKERQEVAARIHSVIQKSMPDCEVQLYGSSLSGFGFRTSGINLNLKSNSKRSPAEMLVTALGVISKDELCKDVGSKFEDKFPVICFTDAKSNLYCELGTGSESAVATSLLLWQYGRMDARVSKLVVAFRHWAHILEIDRPQDGSLPPYVYSLMVIYFLQRCTPAILPVLQESEQMPPIQNEQSLGELWIAIFHCYLVERDLEEEVICIRKRVPPTRKDLNIHNRRIVVDDPCAPAKKSITKYLSSAEVLSYIMDCLHVALEHFAALPDISSPNQRMGTPPESLIGENESTNANSIHTEDPLLKENPTANRSHAREAGVLNAVGDGELSLTNDLSLCSLKGETGENSLDLSETDSGLRIEPLEEETGDECGERVSDKGEPFIATTVGDATEDADCPNSTEILNERKKSCGKLKEHFVVDDELSDKGDSLPTVLNFSFDKQTLSRGQNVPKICSNCLQEGHVSKDCEDDKLPELKPLPPMQSWYLSRIHQLSDFVSEKFATHRREVEFRSRFILDLEKYIQRNSTDPIKLELFGSSVNGFGFQNSDLDICMTFRDSATGEGINVPEIIQTLAIILRRHPDLFSVIPITTAKVPIVKFVHRPTNLEGDISLYNLLAQHNTQLLRRYAEIDRRVCRLGHMVKAFAKECGIADASRGSLSSYAYILMTLYFLQQTKPPVIPVLQELYNGDQKPERIVEGRNTWFYDNVRNLKKVWKGHGRNKLSEADLWLGFLRFYTESFDFAKYVICVRQRKLLTRFEKMWMGGSRGFAIEDPFDLDHNLGGALSRKMANYIMLIFRKGRERFGTSQNTPSNIYAFFFNYDYLTDGQQPPNDRGCRICGKIGHFVKDCPVKLRGKEKKQRSKAATPQKKPPEDASESPKPQEPAPSLPKKETNIKKHSPAVKDLDKVSSKEEDGNNNPKEEAKGIPNSDKRASISQENDLTIQEGNEVRSAGENKTKEARHSDSGKETVQGIKLNQSSPSSPVTLAESLPSPVKQGKPVSTSTTPQAAMMPAVLPVTPPVKNMAPPGQVPTSPRQGGTPPRQTGTPPRQGGTPPIQFGAPPIKMSTPPLPYGTRLPISTPPIQYGTPSKPGGTPSLQFGSFPMPIGTPPRQIGTPPWPIGTPPRPVGTPYRQVTTPPRPLGPHPRPGGTPPLSAGGIPQQPSGSSSQTVGTPPRPVRTPPSPSVPPGFSSVYGSPGLPFNYGMGPSPVGALSPRHAPPPSMSPHVQYPGNLVYPSSPGVNPHLGGQPTSPLMMPFQGVMTGMSPHQNTPMKAEQLAQASAELQQLLGMIPQGKVSSQKAPND